jgi:hypothetical protein
MTSVIQTGNTANTVGQAELRQQLIKLNEKMDDFLCGSFHMSFTPGRSRMLPQGFDRTTGRRYERTPPSPLELGPPVVDLGGPLPVLPTPMERQHEASAAYVPCYKLSRQVLTIPDLWREWTVGLGGLPSVMCLDATYGSRWRGASERQYYSMRKVLIDEIVARAGGIDNTEALEATVTAMEGERVMAKASLDKFIKEIKQERKARP